MEPVLFEAHKLTPTTPYRRAVRSFVVPAEQSKRPVIATSLNPADANTSMSSASSSRSMKSSTTVAICSDTVDAAEAGVKRFRLLLRHSHARRRRSLLSTPISNPEAFAGDWSVISFD